MILASEGLRQVDLGKSLGLSQPEAAKPGASKFSPYHFILFKDFDPEAYCSDVGRDGGAKGDTSPQDPGMMDPFSDTCKLVPHAYFSVRAG